jgi:hypothetical protein
MSLDTLAGSSPSRAIELPFDPETEPLDVARIMSAIRDQNRRLREQGFFTSEELEQIVHERIRAFADKAFIDPLLLERFLRPGHDWNIAADYLIRTHRHGVLPRLSLLIKRLLRPVVRLYTDQLFYRQMQINQYFCHLAHSAVRENVRLEARLKQLEARCAQLERENGARIQE